MTTAFSAFVQQAALRGVFALALVLGLLSDLTYVAVDPRIDFARRET